MGRSELRMDFLFGQLYKVDLSSNLTYDLFVGRDIVHLNFPTSHIFLRKVLLNCNILCAGVLLGVLGHRYCRLVVSVDNYDHYLVRSV